MMEKQQQQQQQLLAKEVFSPQVTKFRRERIIPLYKDETWSADLIDKSSLSKYNNNYKFILTVIDIFTKYACASPLKKKSGLSITNGFKTILSECPQDGSESRKPEKIWVDRGSDFYNKTFKSLLKEYETKLYSTYSDLKSLFIERSNRTLLHIINKPMFINGDGNWVNILSDAVIIYNNYIHSTINMTPVDASNNPDTVRYIKEPASQIISTSTKIKPKGKPGYAQLKVGDYVRNADKRNIFSEGYTSNWMGVKVTKIHRVIKIKQDYICRDYKQNNTKKRAAAKTEAEKDVRKSMNNSLYGRMCTNPLHFIQSKFLNDEEKIMKSISKPTFKNITRYKDYSQSEHIKKKIEYDSPVYVGVTI